MKNKETWEYKIREQNLDKTRDEIAMRIGYTVVQLYGLINQYAEAEKKFYEWARQERKE